MDDTNPTQIAPPSAVAAQREQAAQAPKGLIDALLTDRNACLAEAGKLRALSARFEQRVTGIDDIIEQVKNCKEAEDIWKQIQQLPEPR